MKGKIEADWDRLGPIVQQTDPFAHLGSIHNGTVIYNHTRPWVTHASIQNGSAVENRAGPPFTATPAASRSSTTR